MAQLNLSSQEIINRINAENINISAGKLIEGNTQYLVRTLNQFTNIKQIGELVVYRDNDKTVTLNDIALLISLERFFSLLIMGGKIRRQLKDDVARDDNPLGRVMKVKDQFPDVAHDTLELKLSEAILREMPKVTRNLTLIKIISVVAPLLGLLGTVTGMINTFQAITLFGTGDPKLMAGGISQALVTTVLGLVVAIPTVFLYTLLNTRAKNILLTIQEQSAGIIAQRSEKGA